MLANYIDQNTFQRVKAKLKRIQLHYQNRDYAKCFELGSISDSNEDFYQNRDRLLLMGYCGTFDYKEAAVIPILENELDTVKNPYRMEEMLYVLAQAYFKQRKYEISIRYLQQFNQDDLEKEAMFKIRLLFVENLLKLNKTAEAGQKLGDLDQYRQSKYYKAALNLQAELDAAQGKVDDSVKGLLRVYYSPSSSEDEKQFSLLRVGEILAVNQRSKEAKDYLEKIDRKWINAQESVYQRYLQLKGTLDNSTD
jgi:hypothetical protein